MDTKYYFIIAVIMILVVVGLILAPFFAHRKRSQQFHDKFGAEYDRTVKTSGNHKKAQAEMNEREKHVGTLSVHPLSSVDHDRYLADWSAIQAKFIDQPGQAIVEADHLITEVMRKRDYPVSDFEQRAADISINYPDLVSNYRLAREIANKNSHHQASTEELRQAMVYYRSLVDELLKTETVVSEK
jgi:FtsZ-interacting cell division protein ZipA